MIAIDGSPGEPVYANGAIWVQQVFGQSVARIDIETEQVTHSFDLASQPNFTRVLDGAVFVAYPDDGCISRIEP